MNVLQAVILGIVQGITEFLPVSSSGHLVLLQSLFGINEPTMLFDVILHVGTLIPILIIFRNEIITLIKKPFQKMTYLLIAGTIPAVIVALLFGDIIDTLFEGTAFLAIGFIITGILLLVADKVSVGKKTDRDITFTDALIVGCIQAIAITPGISRSGSTITASLFCKMNRDTAARFSFLLAIPAILGALVLQLKDIITGDIPVESINWINMAAGFLAAGLSGYLAIRFMLALIKKAKLKYFSIYVFALAAVLTIKIFI